MCSKDKKNAALKVAVFTDVFNGFFYASATGVLLKSFIRRGEGE